MDVPLYRLRCAELERTLLHLPRKERVYGSQEGKLVRTFGFGCVVIDRCAAALCCSVLRCACRYHGRKEGRGEVICCACWTKIICSDRRRSGKWEVFSAFPG